MGLLAALCVKNGKVVTGCNHGEAFGKLSTAEQDGDLKTGFLNLDTGQFTEDDKRSVILIRHAQAKLDGEDPAISEVGMTQTQRTADYLATLDLSDYQCFCSPYLRCLQTADLIFKKIHLIFSVEPLLAECQDAENPEEFISRTQHLFEQLPAKTVIVSHCDIILALAQLACEHELHCGIPNASVTRIDNHVPLCVGKVA